MKFSVNIQNKIKAGEPFLVAGLVSYGDYIHATPADDVIFILLPLSDCLYFTCVTWFILSLVYGVILVLSHIIFLFIKWTFDYALYGYEQKK